MSAAAVTIRTVRAEEAHALVPALCEILIDCVEGGASVGFLTPLRIETAAGFWREVAEGVTAGGRKLLVAEAGGEVIGTAQLIFASMPNQPHRADISKVLVRRAARRRGVGEALMRAADQEARAAGRTVLVLDTASDAAERLYEREGWTRVGVVPDYALMPDGSPCDTAFYYKRLG